MGTGTGLTRDGVPGFACPQGVPPNLPVPTVFPSVRRVPPEFARPQGDGWGDPDLPVPRVTDGVEVSMRRGF